MEASAPLSMLSPTTRRRLAPNRANVESSHNTLNDLTTGLHNSLVPMTRAGFHALLRQRELLGPDSSPTPSLASSASPSPDELAIQARGRRQMPITFSPDVHLHTPPRRVASAPTSRLASNSSRLWLLPKRSSPRKRLNLSDVPVTPPKSGSPSSVFFTPSPEARAGSRRGKDKNEDDELDEELLPPSMLLHKKLRMDEESVREEQESNNVRTLMQGLSADQLVKVLNSLLDAQPDLQNHLQLPEPDVVSLEQELIYFRKNITKSLPSTRLEPKTGPMAYNRASLHLQNFQRTLVSQSKRLMDAQQWKAAVEHACLAWPQIKATPEWDNPVHNNVRKRCFKTIASNCLVAIKAKNWTKDEAGSFFNSLRLLEKEGGTDIAGCLQHLEATSLKENDA